MSETQSKHDFNSAETDEQLMAAFCCGSADAFNALFGRYRQPVFGFFCRRVGDGAQAEELAQETFLALLRAEGRYQATALFRTWLYSVALNILRTHRRKSIFRGMFSGKPADAHEPVAPVHLEADITLRQAVSKLDAIDREVLMLREYEELSYAEISMILRIPVNTVRSRLFRARAALRDLLAAPAIQRNQSPKGAAKGVEEHA